MCYIKTLIHVHLKFLATIRNVFKYFPNNGCHWVLNSSLEKIKCNAFKLQADLRDTAGLVPDHCNKMSISAESQKCWFHSAYIRYIYTLLSLYLVCNCIIALKNIHMLCLLTQSCLTLCNPMHCSPPGSSVHGDSPGKNTGVGCIYFPRGSTQPRD